MSSLPSWWLRRSTVERRAQHRGDHRAHHQNDMGSTMTQYNTTMNGPKSTVDILTRCTPGFDFDQRTDRELATPMAERAGGGRRTRRRYTSFMRRSRSMCRGTRRLRDIRIVAPWLRVAAQVREAPAVARPLRLRPRACRRPNHLARHDQTSHRAHRPVCRDQRAAEPVHRSILPWETSEDSLARPTPPPPPLRTPRPAVSRRDPCCRSRR